jgi:hypothetical protein
MKTLERMLPVSMLTLLFFCFLSPAALFSQIDTADSDSAAVSEMKQLQRELLDQIRELRRELAEERTTPDTAERTDRMDDIERRLSLIEERIDSLDVEISARGGELDGWDDWDDSWDSEWTGGKDGKDSDWSWWLDTDEEESQFDLSESFFRKYPGNYPWMFPLVSRLHETFFRYNRVEGAYIGIAQVKRLYWHSKPWIVGTGSLGYGFANRGWRYSLGLYLPFYFENQIVEIGGEGHRYTDSKDEWRFDRDENTMTAFFAREDFLDYFERSGFTVSASWYYRGDKNLNLRGTLGYAHDSYDNMRRVTNWSVFGGGKTFRQNPLINDGNINSFIVSGAAHTLPSLSDRSKGWDAQFFYESAGGAAKGDFDFTQLTVDVRRYQPLNEHLALNLRARFGFSDGDVPVQRQFELGGPGTLPGFRYKEFAAAQMGLINSELIIRSSIAGNARGWARNVLRNLNIILFFDAGAIDGSDSDGSGKRIAGSNVRRGAMQASFGGDNAFDTWVSNVGVAVGSANGEVRIGAAWRLDRDEAPNLVLRLSRPF